MGGLWEILARVLSADPGWTGARDGRSGYPSRGHGVAVATYGNAGTAETAAPAAVPETGVRKAREAANG